jgi:peptidoglycan/xylan/chitin deacetylase (PgdA/CDA1 family)
MSCRSVTLVTYHYVRPLAGSQFPRLHGLDLSDFDAQLDYLHRHYHFVSNDTVRAMFNGEPVDLPPNPVLLTFDDGYADHFRYVFPRLFDRKISAAFYPAASSALDRQLLDANRVHFVLAAIGDPGALIEMIEGAIESGRASHQLWTVAQYRAEFMTRSRFDEPRVAYVKRMLQFGLPDGFRQTVADAAFQRFVTGDEAGFAEELYMGGAELRTMASGGQHIGLHSDRHVWLGKLPREEQEAEIKGSFRVLDALGMGQSGFSFCFPYGSYNQDTLSLLDDLGCGLAMTTRSAVASMADHRFELPRLDTTELPRV